MKSGLLIFVLLVLISSHEVFSQEEDMESVEEASIDELNRQLENPLSRFWSLIFQENLSFNSGDAISGTEISNVFNFQPSLPVPVGRSKMLLVRPVFPLVTTPVFDETGTKTDTETGLGDINVFSLYGPDKKDGLIWGAGSVFCVSHGQLAQPGFRKISSRSCGNGIEHH